MLEEKNIPLVKSQRTGLGRLGSTGLRLQGLPELLGRDGRSVDKTLLRTMGRTQNSKADKGFDLGD